jgi:hypothetical protein
MKHLGRGMILAFLLTAPLFAKAELIGVSFSFVDSPVVRIDETTGIGVPIGLSGFPGLNSLAKNSAGTLFSAVNTLGASPDLITIDPHTGAGTFVSTLNFGGIRPDIRGLAFSSNDTLFAINNTGPAGGLNPDDLFIIDVATGVGNRVGATRLTGVQSITFSPGGTLFGWDVNIGLVTIDPTTGTASDVNTFVGGNPNIQGITFTPDGTLFGARDALFTIDVATGVHAFAGANGYADVRGIEYMLASIRIPEPMPLALLMGGFGAMWFLRRPPMAMRRVGGSV